MPRVAIAYYTNPSQAKEVIESLAASGIDRRNVRFINELRTNEDVLVGSLDLAGSESGAAPITSSRSEFEAQLGRELLGFGLSQAEMETYVHGVRGGGALVLVSGADRQVDAAVDILNRKGALDVERVSTETPVAAAAAHLPRTTENMTPVRDESVQAGRNRTSGGGARVFVW